MDVMLASLPAHVPVPAPPVQPEEFVKKPPAKRVRTYPESGECFRGRSPLGATIMMMTGLRVSGDGRWKSGWSW